MTRWGRLIGMATVGVVLAAVVVGIVLAAVESGTPEQTSRNPVVVNRQETPERASVAEIVLTAGGLVVVVGGCIAARVWVQRRRRSGEEAAAFTAQNADISYPGSGGTGGV